MHLVLKKQKNYFIKNCAPSYELRIDRLNRMKDIILQNKNKIVDALNEDFGVRSKNQSMVADVYSIIPDIEYAKKNININCVSPGFIKTEMTEKINEDFKKMLIDKIPSGKLGTGDDVSNCIAFLASDMSSYINGETIHVNGGMYMA